LVAVVIAPGGRQLSVKARRLSALTTYTCDRENRLLSLALSSSYSYPSGAIVTNIYDGNGLRQGYRDCTGPTTLTYDGQNVYRRDLQQYTCSVQRYTNEPGDYSPLISQGDTRSGATAFVYAVSDLSGNVRNWWSGGSGGYDPYVYEAFGIGWITPPQEPPVPYNVPFFYNGDAGYYLDPTTRLYFIKARWYDPVTGRFISEDPIGFDGEDRNLYRYVENNPARWSDPSRLLPYAPYPSPHGPLPGDYGQHCGGLISEPITTGSEDQIDECCAVHDGCLDYVDRTGWSWTWKTSGHLVCDANLCHCAKCAKCAMTPCAEERALIISYFCTSPHEGFPGSGFPSRKAPPCLPTENNACCTIDAYSGPPFHIKRKDNDFVNLAWPTLIF
jgi:RHS repeat-associated protein